MTPAPGEAFVAGVIEKLSPEQRRAVMMYMPEKGRWRNCGIIFWTLEQDGIVRRRKNPGGSVSCQPTALGLLVRHQLLRMESGS